MWFLDSYVRIDLEFEEPYILESSMTTRTQDMIYI